MEDEEHEDLLIRASSDNEDFTDNEDAFASSRRSYLQHENLSSLCFERIKFICLGIVLVLSSTALLILLPLYLETVNVYSDAYTMLVFICFVTTVIILLMGCLLGRLLNQLKVMLSIPFSLSRVYRFGLAYGLGGFLLLYAVDRKRVMCHLQDPIKGIVLVFSLVYYFFFCKKMMGLQQIFCSTTIVVGLFVSVDYGLCDEFRCRGNEREHRSEDAGSWSWQVHSLWTVLYIVALALWTLHSTLLEGFLVMQQGILYMGPGSSLLSTVSRLVSTRDSSSSTVRHSRPLLQATEEDGDFSSLPQSQSERNTAVLDQHRQVAYMKPLVITGSRPSAISIALWIHIVSLQLLIALCWTDMIPSFGKGSSASEFWSFFTSGFLCHFGVQSNNAHNGTNMISLETETCKQMALYAWPFIISYTIFSLSFVQFLIISESSVFTVAMTTAALPLGSIWWSIFRMAPLESTNLQNLLQWSPSVTGELICSILGLPVVVVGLAILYKSHFQDNVLGKPIGRLPTTGVA
ncbi:Uncharacterized protein GBIM_05544 [Gryllus bimaculatus]|nr:Uncharacterized protein GBIM_05544 [Gryllus bimaculatus]